MKTFIVLTTDNEPVAVVHADSKNEARMFAARALREPLAFLVADEMTATVHDLRRKD